MNKKQKEAKRKNAQQHQKKTLLLAKEREVRLNSPEYRERLLNRHALNAKLFGTVPCIVTLGKPAPLEELVIPFSMAGMFVDIPETWKGALDKLIDADPEASFFAGRERPAVANTLAEAYLALQSDPEVAAYLKSVSSHQGDDALEGEFEIVKAPIKQLLKTPGSFGYIKHDENK